MQIWLIQPPESGGDEGGVWSYDAIDSSNLKEYKVSGEYTDTYFGTEKIVTPVSGTTGEDRFYVMALEDVDSSAHYWYYNVHGNLPDEKWIDMNENDFGAGLENTEYWLDAYENDNQYTSETFGNFTELWEMDEVGSSIGNSNSVWFVPSKSEWSAFRRCVWNYTRESWE